jgi:hypothetical protein
MEKFKKGDLVYIRNKELDQWVSIIEGYYIVQEYDYYLFSYYLFFTTDCCKDRNWINPQKYIVVKV